jgi:hypothetical protein
LTCACVAALCVSVRWLYVATPAPWARCPTPQCSSRPCLSRRGLGSPFSPWWSCRWTRQSTTLRGTCPMGFRAWTQVRDGHGTVLAVCFPCLILREKTRCSPLASQAAVHVCSGSGRAGRVSVCMRSGTVVQCSPRLVGSVQFLLDALYVLQTIGLESSEFSGAAPPSIRPQATPRHPLLPAATRVCSMSPSAATCSASLPSGASHALCHYVSALFHCLVLS